MWVLFFVKGNIWNYSPDINFFSLIDSSIQAVVYRFYSCSVLYVYIILLIDFNDDDSKKFHFFRPCDLAIRYYIVINRKSNARML